MDCSDDTLKNIWCDTAQKHASNELSLLFGGVFTKSVDTNTYTHNTEQQDKTRNDTKHDPTISPRN